jgi:hypothetical protein
LTWSRDWNLGEEFVQGDSEFESVLLDSDNFIQGVSLYQSDVDLVTARDYAIEAFTNEAREIIEVDRSDYSGIAYSLDLMEFEDGWYGFFTIVSIRGDHLMVLTSVAPQDQLGDAVDLASTSIELDGLQIYDGIDGSGLQDLIDEVNEDEGSDDAQKNPSKEQDEPDNTESGTDPQYFDEVAEHYEELENSVDDFNSLIQDADPDEDNFEDVMVIVDLWLESEAIARSYEPEQEQEAVHDAYLAYTDALSDSAKLFQDWIDTWKDESSDSPVYEEALNEFLNRFAEVDELGDELSSALEGEGIDVGEETDDDDPEIGSDFIFTMPKGSSSN